MLERERAEEEGGVAALFREPKVEASARQIAIEALGEAWLRTSLFCVALVNQAFDDEVAASVDHTSAFEWANVHKKRDRSHLRLVRGKVDAARAGA